MFRPLVKSAYQQNNPLESSPYVEGSDGEGTPPITPEIEYLFEDGNQYLFEDGTQYAFN